MISITKPITTITGKSEDLVVTWLDPKGSYTKDFLNNWRENVKRNVDYIFYRYRPRLCMVCGYPFSVFDMHEGIVSRKDVQGWSKRNRHLIMTELNCIPLHHTCHLDSPPSRQDVWEYQKEFYGNAMLQLWYNELPWKLGKPPRYF